MNITQVKIHIDGIAEFSAYQVVDFRSFGRNNPGGLQEVTAYATAADAEVAYLERKARLAEGDLAHVAIWKVEAKVSIDPVVLDRSHITRTLAKEHKQGLE